MGQKLYQEIKDIQEKAQHAEQTVQDITQDIKSLDCAKKNLTTSVTVLKRLQMLGAFFLFLLLFVVFLLSLSLWAD
jgi:prefoldin subunit 5